ncbi:hypothetical protein MOBT1_001101 [Malassezia obtusa]|uniref:Uncharacterized protein n=1 Tax=Malassezia obtusa TaxID=76774 RepID=A0AAF0ISR2_9BASI|nr:hypothetical protein MOBT1_001101 [Malassezia obtusa]
MSAAPPPLVPPSAARDAACAAVLHACAHLGTAERPAAETALRQFAARDSLVDDAAYVLAASDAPDVHFHVLGALLSQLARLAPEDAARAVPSLTTLRDWILQRALTHAMPPYVVTRQMHAVVLLTKRATSLTRPEPTLALGQHAAVLVSSAEHAPLGLQLALALAEDLGETPRADDVPLGLSADEHAWCHALVQVHTLPALLPAVLNALQAAHDAAALVPAADAAHALLAWSWNTALPADGVQLAPEQLLEAVQRPARDARDGGVPAALAELLLAPALPALLSDAARAAQRLAHSPSHAWAARRAARHLRAALQTVAAYAPGEHTALWAQQRTALAAALGAHVEETSARMSTPGADLGEDVDALRVLAQLYARLVAGASGRVLLAAAPAEVDAVLRALALLTQSAFHAALYVLPAGGDEEALAEADAAVTEVLALWRTLLHALAAPDAPPVADAVHAHVREHVVCAYHDGRLHAAALSAASDVECGVEQASDAEAYDEQLTLYAALARTCLAEALARLTASLAALQAALADAPTDATWEQLHWLALLGAHLVADPAAAEEPSVPSAVADADAATQDALLAFLHAASLVLLPALLPHGPHDAHPASPQTVASLLWMTARWVPTYLLRTDGPPRVLAPLAGDAGAPVLDALLMHVRTALDGWRADADVLVAAAGVLEAFAHTPGAMTMLLARDAMHALVRDTLAALDTLPDAAHAPLLRACVRCLDAARDGVVPAADARAAYYPLVLDAVHARIAAAVRASGAPQHAASAHAALRLVEVLAEGADPYTSRHVHEQLAAQLPAVAQIAQALAAHADVVCAALDAAAATLRALEELGDAPHTDAALATHTLLHAVRPTLHDADNDEALVAYLRTATALAHLGSAPDATRAAADALVGAAPVLTPDALRLVPVREAFAELTTALLLKGGAALLACAQGAPSGTASPLDVLDAARAPPLVIPGGNPFEVTLRAVALLLGTADATIDAQVAALAPALGLLVGKVPDLAPEHHSAPLVHAAFDQLAWDVLRALLLRPLHLPVLSPLVLALRALTLARVRATWLGGQASFFGALEAACAAEPAPRAALLAQSVQHVLQRILASRPEPPASGVAPALAARLLAKEEQAACIALCRTMRPQLLQTRGMLCVQ